MRPLLHGSDRLRGDSRLRLRYCSVHGVIMPADIIWHVVHDKHEPICPECKQSLIQIKSCPKHGDILFKEMIWKDEKPYCPTCGMSLEIFD